MKKLLLLTPLLLMGCTSDGMGFGYNGPGYSSSPGTYTCTTAGASAANYCATGEHPHLCDCE
jgi:hypothetical protein